MAPNAVKGTQKAFTVGTIPQQSAEHPIPQPKPNEAKQGEGVGQLLTNMFGKKKRKEKLRKQARKAAPAQKAAPASPVAKARVLLNEGDALNWIRKSVPGVKDATARTFLKTALRMIAQGKV